VVPTVDTPAAGVILLTGDSAFQLNDDTLSTKDAITLKATGNGEFAEVDVITGGTGVFAGTTGTLTATGTFTADAGGSGSCTGDLCAP
jgi:hypothetical protein